MLGLGLGLNKMAGRVRPKNLLVYNSITWAEWELGPNAQIVDGTLRLAGTGNSSNTKLSCNPKPNTKYGILIESLDNSISDTGVRFYNSLTGSWIVPFVATNFNGLTKHVITTQSVITDKYVGLSLASTALTGSVRLKDVRMFELPTGSEIEADFTNLTADQLNVKYPF